MVKSYSPKRILQLNRLQDVVELSKTDFTLLNIEATSCSGLLIQAQPAPVL